MNYQSKTKEELINELQELKQEKCGLEALYNKTAIESKKTEAELIEINRRLVDAQSVAKVGSWETDLSNLEVNWSEETFRIFELDPLSFHTCHPNFMQFVHPDDRESVDKAFQGSFDNHTINTIQHRILTGKGKLKFIEENWRIYYNDQGQAIRALGTCSDITEQKQLDFQLRTQHDRINNVLESMNDAFVSLDKNWCYTYMNKKAGEIFARDPKDMIGKNIWTEFPEGVGQPFHLNYEKAMRDRVYIRMEEYYPPYNKWFENRISPTEDGIAIFFSDITESKRAQEKLNESEKRWRRAIVDSPIPIMIHDEDGKVLQISIGWTKYSGYTLEDMPTLADWTELAYNERQGLKKEFIEQLFTIDKTVNNGDWIINAKDGSKRIWSFHATPLGKLNNGKRVLQSMAIDITEIKRYEEELVKAKEKAEESEAQQKALLDNAVFAVNIVSQGGELLYFNMASCNLFGFDVGQSDKYNASTFWKNPNQRNQLIEKLNSNGKLINFEADFYTAGNNTSTLLVSSHIITYNHERVIFSIYNDITDRKKLEKSNQEARENAEINEERFRKYFEQDLIGFAITSIEKDWIEVNDAVCNYLGYTKDELIQKNWAELTHPDDLDADLQQFQLLLNGKISGYKLDKRFINKHGETVYTELSVRRENDSKGKIKYFLALINNITERKLIEIELIHEKTKAQEITLDLKNAQSIAHIGNWKWDLAGNQVYWSDEMYSIFGIDKQSYTGDLGDVIAKVIHPDDLYIVLPSNAPKIAGRQPIEYRIIMPDNSIRHIWAKAGETIMDENNKPLFLSGIAQDITSRKIVEFELLTAKEKAEESDKLKSAFLANMSHEIRTPMNGILGFANLLKDSKLSGEEQQEYISIIEKSGARMLNIINDIIDISKIESGQIEVNIGDSNVNDQIEYLYTFFKPEVEHKGMQLVFKNSLPSKESIIQTDREKVFAILTNLIKNAIKYSNTGTIEFGYNLKTTEPAELEFFVKDQGIGIPMDRHAAIFERFIQADIGDKRAYEGAGLGLAITKSYVEMLGGKIWVESQEEIGSTFYFTLPYLGDPVNKMKEDKLTDLVSVENPIKPLKILIAEDNFYAAKLLEIVVRKMSKEILIVNTGTEAVEVCRNNPDIDLILMDIKMPKMDGYEATRQIRLFNKKVVVIAQTAFALIGDEEDALAAGCNDYIVKPIKSGLLRELIINHLDR